jgi:SAM-dependent methyltransferase
MFRKFEHSPYEFLQDNALIYDIGSKDITGGEYAFGKPPDNAQVVGVDIEPGPGVDIVADAHDLFMVEDSSVDCVVTVSTLGHVRYPQKMMKEIYRILRPGGFVYASVPFIFPFNKDPQDLYRFTSDGIKVLCEDFECIENGFNRGPASCMCHLLVHFCAMTLSFSNKVIYGINIDLFKWLLFWIKYLDIILGKYQMAYVIHAGSYFLGQKPEESDKLSK